MVKDQFYVYDLCCTYGVRLKAQYVDFNSGRAHFAVC